MTSREGEAVSNQAWPPLVVDTLGGCAGALRTMDARVVPSDAVTAYRQEACTIQRQIDHFSTQKAPYLALFVSSCSCADRVCYRTSLIVKERVSPLSSYLETVHGCRETVVALHLPVQHGVPLDVLCSVRPWHALCSRHEVLPFAADFNGRSKLMRSRRGCVDMWGVVRPPGLSTRLHQILMATTLMLGLSLVPVLAAAGPFREVVVFGDSLSDTGNVFAATEAVLPEAVPVSPPYYQGRFSNGPVWVERLAEKLGLPLRPFLHGGTNFAFGGAAIGFDTPDLFENDVRVLIPSLRTQVTTFLVQHLFDKADPAALYIVWGGANDLRDALVTSPDPFAEARQAVEDLTAAIADLAEARAVSFLVLNMPNLAWTPESRRRGPAAMTQATAVSVAFNHALATALDAVEAKHPITIIRLDTFTLLQAIIAAPDRFDLTNVTEPCWAGNPFARGTPCPQPQTHLFWDSIHPTTAAHALLADLAFAALTPLRVAHGDTSPAPSIKDALRALLPLSLKNFPGNQLRLDRWLHW